MSNSKLQATRPRPRPFRCARVRPHFGVGVLAAALLSSAAARADERTAAPEVDPAKPAPAIDVASWRAGDPVSPGYQVVLRPRRWLVSTGAALFTLPYLSSAIGAASGYDADNAVSSARAALWIPLVGPFVALGDPNATDSVAAGVLYVLDGLSQLAGAALFAYGLASPVPTLVRQDSPSHVTLAIVPLHVAAGSGASLVATF